MPANSTSVHEEGILVRCPADSSVAVACLNPNFATNWLLSPGRPATRTKTLRTCQPRLAASERGIQELHAMIAEFGLETVHAYMGHVQRHAEEQVRHLLTRLHSGTAEVELDDGAVIRVKIDVDRKAPFGSH